MAALTLEELEAKVSLDEFKLAGEYVAGRGFVDPDLDRLLKQYLGQDQLELKRADAKELPPWLGAWQARATAKTWGRASQGRAGIAEALLRWFFRRQCALRGVDYAPACDELFAQLWSPAARAAKKDAAKEVAANEDAAKPDAVKTDNAEADGAKAADSSEAVARAALEQALAADGWAYAGGAAWDFPERIIDPDRAGTLPLRPGDIVTYCVADGPRRGRAGTVLFADGARADAGNLWLASNAGPDGAVILERFMLEPMSHDVAAALDAGDPRLPDWSDTEARPPAGRAWILGVVPASALQPARIAALDDDARATLRLEPAEVQATPGTVLPRSARRPATGAHAGHSIASKATKPARDPNAPPPLLGPESKQLPPPVQLDAQTLRLSVGERPAGSRSRSRILRRESRSRRWSRTRRRRWRKGSATRSCKPRWALSERRS